jgi:hypothetical protein
MSGLRSDTLSSGGKLKDNVGNLVPSMPDIWPDLWANQGMTVIPD